MHKDIHLVMELGFQPSLAESKAHVLISSAVVSHLKSLSDVSW